MTSIYLQGIDSGEIIETVHARRAPMIPVSASLRLRATAQRVAALLVAHCDTERTLHDARVSSISAASLTGVTAAAAALVAERTGSSGH